MKRGNKVVFGIFDSRADVERAVDMLKAAEFRNSDISVLMPRVGDDDTLAHEKSSKAPEGATWGGGAGAVVGGTLGWLAGIGAVTLIPPLGPFVAAGPIMAALAGAGAGSVVGGLTGALVGFGMPEYEAKRYEGFLKDGGILLSVHVDDNNWLKKAKNILETADAHDIASSTEEDVGKSDRTDKRMDSSMRT